MAIQTAGWVNKSTSDSYVYPQLIKPGMATLGGVQYFVIPHLPPYSYGATTKFLPMRTDTGAEVVTNSSSGKALSPVGRGLAEVFDAGTGTHLQVFTGCSPYTGGQAKLNFEKFSLVPGTSCSWVETKSLNIGPASVTDLKVTNFVLDGGVLKGIATWATTSPTDRVYRLFSWDLSSASLTTIKDWYQTADGLTVNGLFGWLALAGGNLYLMNPGGVGVDRIYAHQVSASEFTALADVIPLAEIPSGGGERIDFSEETDTGVVHMDIQPNNGEPYGSSRWIPGDDGWAVTNLPPSSGGPPQYKYSGNPLLALNYPYSSGTNVESYYFNPSPSAGSLNAVVDDTDGSYTLNWTYSDPNGLDQAEIKLVLEDMINTTFVVSGAPDTSYNGEYKYAKRNWGRAVYTNGLRWLYSVIELISESYLGEYSYSPQEYSSWFLGAQVGSPSHAYSGGGYLPTDNAGAWSGGGSTIPGLAVATGTLTKVDTGWISYTDDSYTGSVPESEYQISLEIKNSPPLSITAGPYVSSRQSNRMITKRQVPWTRPTLSSGDLGSSYWGTRFWIPGRWLSVPTPTAASTNFHVLDRERQIFGSGTLARAGGFSWVPNSNTSYGMSTLPKNLKGSDWDAKVPSYESAGPVTDDPNVTVSILNALNTADLVTYRIDEEPHPPVCVLKMMTHNPYFLYRSDSYLIPDQDVTCLGGNYNYVTDIVHQGLFRMHGVDSPMPLRNENMTTRGLVITVPVTLAYGNGGGSTAYGYSDQQIFIPAKVWVAVTFSTDGRGGAATTRLLEAEVAASGTLTFTIDAADITGDYIDEIDLYWRNRYYYYRKLPFPTSTSYMMESPYKVFLYSTLGIISFKLALQPA